MNTLKTLLTTVFTVGFLFFNYSFGQNNDVVMIRAMETYGAMGRYTPEMVIVSPNGEKNTLELEKGSANKFGEDAGKNAVIIQKEIGKWLEKGFKISHFSTDGGEAFTRTFIIMTKEEE